MGALDELRREHGVILEVAKRMSALVSGEPDPDAWHRFLRGATEFIRVYIDHNHEAKEEGALFEFMRADSTLVPIADLLVDEHGYGKRLSAEIDRALDAQFDAYVIRRAVVSYVAFISDHAALENEMIFGNIERVLTAEDDARLAAAFAEVERSVLGRDGLGQLLQRMDIAEQPPQTSSARW